MSIEIKSTNDLPPDIQESFQYMAGYLLSEMMMHKQQVILIPAPRPQHEGHMIRQAVSFNPAWWSELYNTYHGTKLDRACFQNALERIGKGQDGGFKYDVLARDFVKKCLIEGLYGEMADEDVKGFFESDEKNTSGAFEHFLEDVNNTLEVLTRG